MLIFILFAVSAACGLGGLYSLAAGYSLSAVVALHVVAAYFGWAAACYCDTRRSGKRSFLFLCAFTIPFVGGIASYWLARSVRDGVQGCMAEQFAVYIQDAATYKESIPVSQAKPDKPDDLIPMADLLFLSASDTEQRIAVENLSGMDSAEAIQTLETLVDHQQGEGRFFAMTALSRLQDHLFSRLRQQEKEHQSGHSDDPESYLKLARAHLDFAYYKQAKDSRLEQCLSRADVMASEAFRSGRNPDALIIRGRVELLRGNAGKAVEYFTQYLSMVPADVRAWLWRAEAWFKDKRYQMVLSDCQKAASLGGIPFALEESVSFWLSAVDDRIREGKP